MTIYLATFPDNGDGLTKKSGYIIAENRQEAREKASRHPNYTIWNTDSGTVEPAGIESREELEDEIVKIGTPNSAILEDGMILRRDLHSGGTVEQVP